MLKVNILHFWFALPFWKFHYQVVMGLNTRVWIQVGAPFFAANLTEATTHKPVGESMFP